MFSFHICHVVDRGCLPDGYRLVYQIVWRWALGCTLVVANIFGTRVVSVATSLLLLLLSPML